MPYYPVDRATNFIVQDESWRAIECDFTSVPGTIYISLTENKVNLIYDDLVNDIADTDKMAQYKLSVPAEVQNFTVGDIINPSFTLTKNGVPYAAEVELLPTNKQIAKIVNGTLMAVGEGETTILVQLKEYPSITTNLTIVVNNAPAVFSAYIEGSSKIRLDRKETYILKGTSDIVGEVLFSIDTNLASILPKAEEEPSYICTIHANDKNKIGTFTLTAVYDGVEYTKEISVVPLW